MDVPSTVETALADRPTDGAVCLEAGAGAGNATAGLLRGGASRVYAVTNDADHATTVWNRVREGRVRDADAGEPPYCDRVAVLEADLRDLPLADDSVGVVTAHALFNVVEPASLDAIAAELTRVAAPGCHLIVDDYAPPPDDARVRELFAVENAASELARGRPALTFYPAGVLRGQFLARGWSFDRDRTLLDPVPWTDRHLDAHVGVVREAAAAVQTAGLGERLVAEAERLADAIGEESVGEMYSLAFRLTG